MKQKNNLREAIELVLEDRRQDILRGLPEDAIQEKVAQRRFVWVNAAHFRGKKAVRILNRMYSASR